VDPHPAVTERRVVQQMLPPAVRHRQHAAVPAALDPLVGLHRQAQPVRLALRAQNAHPGHAEHHGRRRAALTTVHLVEAFGVSLLGRY